MFHKRLIIKQLFEYYIGEENFISAIDNVDIQ